MVTTTVDTILEGVPIWWASILPECKNGATEHILIILHKYIDGSRAVIV